MNFLRLPAIFLHLSSLFPSAALPASLPRNPIRRRYTCSDKEVDKAGVFQRCRHVTTSHLDFRGPKIMEEARVE